MTADGPIADRTFSLEVHAGFAHLSGDINPMHMDPVLARRTPVGAPVVHGVHTLLWAIDALAARPDCPVGPTSVQVRFVKPNYVGDSASVSIAKRTQDLVALKVAVAHTTIATVNVAFGPGGSVGAAPPALDAALVAVGTPLELTLGDLPGRTGHVGFAAPSEDFAVAFPDAARVFGADRLRGLAALSRLVGMECPGLHSIFNGLRVDFTAVASTDITYAVISLDERFGLLKMDIVGAGLQGEVDAFLRPAPTPQLTVGALSEVVAPDEFTGDHVLVVGGSRGLGELTAKVAATGGARTTITYVSGIDDAELVAAEIRAFGRDCQVLRYDATQPAGPQLEPLDGVPTHVYYFATDRIMARKTGLFDPERFARMTDVYLTGFYELCIALASASAITAMFPSTAFIDEQPKEFAEYIMAKSAGEALCRQMTQHLPRVTAVSERLPKVLTDQTASVMPSDMVPAVEVIVPLVRAVQAQRA